MSATPTTSPPIASAETRAPDAPRSGAPWRREGVWLAALTVLALLLRLTSLSRSLFNDETVSFALSERGFGHMLGLFGWEANGTPYPALLWPVTRIFGTGVEVLRAPAVVVGVASVPAIYWAAKGFVEDRRVWLLSAALLALNPMAVWYSQVARSYAFVVLGGCLAFGALVRATEQPSRRGMWALYVFAMALLAYSDLLAPWVVLPAQLLIASRARRSGITRMLAALLAAGVLCIPLMIAALISHGRRDALYWLPHLNKGLVELGLQEFSGGFSGVTAVRWLTLLTGIVLLGTATLVLTRAGRWRSREGQTLLIAAAWGVLPPVVLLLISAKVPVFWPRYAIVALPGLCVLAALAVRALLDRGSLRLLAAGCAAALLLIGAYADAKQRNALQQNWPPVMSWLHAERTPSQPVVVDSALMLPSMGYYDAQFKVSDELVVWEWRDTALPRGVHPFKDPTGYGRSPNGPPSVALVQRLAREGGGTVWLVLGEIDTEEQGEPTRLAAVRWARANCSVTRRESTGIEVLRAASCRV